MFILTINPTRAELARHRLSQKIKKARCPEHHAKLRITKRTDQALRLTCPVEGNNIVGKCPYVEWFNYPTVH